MSLNAYDRYYIHFTHHFTNLAALFDDVLVAPIASLVNQVTGAPPAAAVSAGLAAYLRERDAGRAR
jgi:hypothetical protein